MTMAILKDKQVVPVEPEEYVEWLHQNQDFEKSRRVAHTVIPERSLVVSTVFLGIDHGFFGVPKWFETMIYREGSGNSFLDFQNRYTTWDEALEGHSDVVERLKRGEDL